MAGYQTIEALRPILHRGPPDTPVLDRLLFYKPFRPGSPTLVQLKEMRALRASGLPLREIAERMKMWPGTVHRYVRDVALPEGHSSHVPSQFTEAHQKKAARMHRAGFSWTEIGEDLGCGKTIARKLVYGVTRNRSLEVSTPTNEILGAVSRVTGVSRQEIRSARRIGCKAGTPAIRARQLVFWLQVRRAGLSQSKAGRAVGFDHKTVAHAVTVVDRIAQQVALTERMGVRRVARLLWAAEWPKAFT